MHGALAEGKKSWNYFCNLFPQSLPALIEEIHNAVIGFCRELPFSALYFQISYLSLDLRKWENPQISGGQVFQNPSRANHMAENGEKGSAAISVL